MIIVKEILRYSKKDYYDPAKNIYFIKGKQYSGEFFDSILNEDIVYTINYLKRLNELLEEQAKLYEQIVEKYKDLLK